MERNDEGRDTHTQRPETGYVSYFSVIAFGDKINHERMHQSAAYVTYASDASGEGFLRQFFFLLSDRVRDGLNSLGGRRNTLIWGDTWPRQSSSSSVTFHEQAMFSRSHTAARTHFVITQDANYVSCICYKK